MPSNSRIKSFICFFAIIVLSIEVVLACVHYLIKPKPLTHFIMSQFFCDGTFTSKDFSIKKFASLDIGDSKEIVEKKLGIPHSKRQYECKEYWYYSYQIEGKGFCENYWNYVVVFCNNEISEIVIDYYLD